MEWAQHGQCSSLHVHYDDHRSLLNARSHAGGRSVCPRCGRGQWRAMAARCCYGRARSWRSHNSATPDPMSMHPHPASPESCARRCAPSIASQDFAERSRLPPTRVPCSIIRVRSGSLCFLGAPAQRGGVCAPFAARTLARFVAAKGCCGSRATAFSRSFSASAKRPCRARRTPRL